jgi:predicted ferric reductase
LLVGGFAGGKIDWIAKKWFGIVVVIILILIFLISAIKVFNPVFHPDLIITGSKGGPGIGIQLKDFFSSSKWFGSVLILFIAGLVVWFLGKGK